MGTVATPLALVFINVSVKIGNNIVHGGVPNKKIYVTQYSVSSDVPLSLRSSDQTISLVSLDAPGEFGGTSFVSFPLGVGLIASASKAGTVSGYIMGFTA